MTNKFFPPRQVTAFQEDSVFPRAGQTLLIPTPRYRFVRRAVVGASVLVAFGEPDLANPLQGPGALTNRRVAVETIAGIVQERRINGLAGLKEHPLLTECANAYAVTLSNTSCMGHECGSTLTERLKMSGYSYSRCAENLAWGSGCADLVVAGWMGSPGHRANILTPELREIGLAVVASQSSSPSPVWVTVFGTRMDDSSGPNQTTDLSATAEAPAGLCFDAKDESSGKDSAPETTRQPAWFWKIVSRQTRSFLYPSSP